MPMLDELLRNGGSQMGGGAGVNPELEQMLGRLTQLQAGPVKGPGGGMPPAGPQAPGPMMPSAQATPGMPPQQQGGSMAQGMAPEQANVTYQMLVKAGVPPEIAKQAIAEPKFLQEILKEIQKRQQLGAQMQPQQPGAGPMAAPGAGQRPEMA